MFWAALGMPLQGTQTLAQRLVSYHPCLGLHVFSPLSGKQIQTHYRKWTILIFRNIAVFITNNLSVHIIIIILF